MMSSWTFRVGSATSVGPNLRVVNHFTSIMNMVEPYEDCYVVIVIPDLWGGLRITTEPNDLLTTSGPLQLC